MDKTEFEAWLRDSAYLRGALVEMLRAFEGAGAVLAEALAQQIDAGRLAADLLFLQQAAAIDDPSPTRDRLLNAMRGRLQPRRL